MYQEECERNSLTLWEIQQRTNHGKKTGSLVKDFPLHFRNSSWNEKDFLINVKALQIKLFQKF